MTTTVVENVNVICEVPIYDGSRDPEVLDRWILDMKAWFIYTGETDDQKKVNFAVLKLTGLAKLLVTDRVPQIVKWDDLVAALRKAFYPSSYIQDMNVKWLRLCQGFNMPVQEYIHQFNRLRILLNIDDPEDKLVLKFESGLQEHLYRELKYTTITTINDAYKYAQLAEEKFLDQCRLQQLCSSNISKSTSSNPAPPFSSSTKFCQCCKEQGHDKSECFQLKKLALIVQSPLEGDDDTPIEVSSEDTIYDELKGQLNKVTSLQDSTPQMVQDNLFITRAHLAHDFSTACILDNGSQRNLIAKSIVDQLHLPVDRHPHPYALGWKDHCSSSQISHICTVSFAFGPKFVDKATFDVTNMDCCGLLLGQPYQYARKAQYDAFNNTYLLHKDHTKYLIHSTLNLPEHATPQKRCLSFIQQPYPHHYPDLQYQAHSTVLKDSFTPPLSTFASLVDRPQLPEDTTSCGHSTSFKVLHLL